MTKLRLQILFALGLLAGLSGFMFFQLAYYAEGYVGLQLKGLRLLNVIGEPYTGLLVLELALFAVATLWSLVLFGYLVGKGVMG